MNTRLFNDQLAVIASGCEEMHLEQGDARKSGRTFRNVLRALAWASSYPNKRVLYATYSHEHMSQAFRMACDMTSHVERKTNAQSRSIELANGSVVEFRSSRDTGYDVGRKFTHLTRDGE